MGIIHQKCDHKCDYIKRFDSLENICSTQARPSTSQWRNSRPRKQCFDWLTVSWKKIRISFGDHGLLLLELHKGLVLIVFCIRSHRFISWRKSSPFKRSLLHVFIGRIPWDHGERVSIGRINESWWPGKMSLRSITSMTEWNRGWWSNFHGGYNVSVVFFVCSFPLNSSILCSFRWLFWKWT